MRPANIAIIGGTGFEQLPPDIFAEPMDVTTPHGVAHVLSVSDNYTEPHRLYFLPRHGEGHGLAPHQINYRANTLALLQLGVGHVLATNAVGSLYRDLVPGTYVVLSDFIDFTVRLPRSLFEDHNWQHTDFSIPYSPVLRHVLFEAATTAGAPVLNSGVYICCDGPRFESPAEITMFRQWGGDVVGMTGLPEAVFAREAGMEYAAIAVVTNLGAGLSDQPIDHQNVAQRMASALPLLREITMDAARLLVQSWMQEEPHHYLNTG